MKRKSLALLVAVSLLLLRPLLAVAQETPGDLPGPPVADGQAAPVPPVSPPGDALHPIMGPLEPSGLTSCCDTPQTPCVWLNAEYLLWWVKGGPVNTPLVTTGSLSDIPPGALGQPGTHVLFGDKSMNYNDLSGMRLGGGIDIAPGLSLEGSYFLLQNGAVHFSAVSNAAGSPLIARPFFNTQVGVQDALATSDPDTTIGPWAGTASISSYSQLQGWELNLASPFDLGNGWSLAGIGGFRWLSLNEDLNISENITPLTSGVLTFQGAPINVGSTLSDFDHFHTSNTFYGGQIGGRLNWQNGDFGVSLLGKVAFGVNQQIAIIDGNTSLATPGAATVTVPGGVLAQSTNIGHYYRSAFSVVPEAGLKFSYNITPRITATAGYTFLYWTNVARPGNQIDRNINPGLIPSGSVYGNGLPGAGPSFSFHESSFWAQGLSLGLEFRF